MPSGQIDLPKIEDNRDGTIRVQYDPREEGIHELAVKYNGEHVQGKNITFPCINIFLKIHLELFVCRLPIQIPRRFNCIWICNRVWTGIDSWCYW